MYKLYLKKHKNTELVRYSLDSNLAFNIIYTKHYKLFS